MSDELKKHPLISILSLPYGLDRAGSILLPRLNFTTYLHTVKQKKATVKPFFNIVNEHTSKNPLTFVPWILGPKRLNKQ